MTQVSLISVFIPLLPTVIRSCSCFPPSHELFPVYSTPNHPPPPHNLPHSAALLNYHPFSVFPAAFTQDLRCGALIGLHHPSQLSSPNITRLPQLLFFYLCVCVCLLYVWKTYPECTTCQMGYFTYPYFTCPPGNKSKEEALQQSGNWKLIGQAFKAGQSFFFSTSGVSW